MRFKAKFKTLDIDTTGFERALDDFMEVAVRQGAEEWLNAVTGRVPLWSGMARGSLLALSELVNGRVTLSPLKAKSRIPQGRALGSARIVSQRPAYFFEFETNVPHYKLQETSPGRSPSAPWRSFEAGTIAFLAFAQSVGLPRVRFFTREVRVG